MHPIAHIRTYPMHIHVHMHTHATSTGKKVCDWCTIHEKGVCVCGGGAAGSTHLHLEPATLHVRAHNSNFLHLA